MEILQTVPDELFSDTIAASISTPPEDFETTEQPIIDVVEDLIDDVIFGYCLEIHRMTKKGILFLDDIDSLAKEEFKIVDIPGLDIFGQELKKKPLECVCPNCDRNMAASRFAPHLEKCMGMGRCSSRVASRRIANSAARQEDSDNESFPGEDNDNDWGTYKKTKKIKREKHNNSPRGKGRPTNKSQRAEAAGELPCQTVIDNMNNDERKTLLLNICGAIIGDNTFKKLCTRSVRCTLHTEEQRQAARNYLLVETKSVVGAHPDEEVQIDIDTFDDSDSQVLRESLWEREITPTSSPADSTSTVNSSGSGKRARRKTRRE